MRRRGGQRPPAALRILAERRARARGRRLPADPRQRAGARSLSQSVPVPSTPAAAPAEPAAAPAEPAAAPAPPTRLTPGAPPRRSSLFSPPALDGLLDAPEPGALLDAPDPGGLLDAPSPADPPVSSDGPPAPPEPDAETTFFGTPLDAPPPPSPDAPPADPPPSPDAPPPLGAFEERAITPMDVTAPVDEPVGARRYTLFMVPAGGQGPLRQVELSLSQVRMAVTAVSLVALLALVGTVALVVAVPASRSRAALLEENIALRAQMQDVERKLSEVDRELRRLRLYNSQLEELPLDGIPGFGPLSRAEAGKLVWAGRLDPDDLDGALAEWEPGMPMEEPPGEEVAPVDLTEAEVRALELSRRTDRLLEGVRLVEPQAGELVETAQDWRWRQDARPSLVPVPDGRFTSSFGWRRAPFSKRWKFHTGIDLAAPRGTPVYAAGAGTVVRSEWQSGYGRFIVIDHGEGVVSRYAHNSRVYVRRGDKVERGERIAAVGTTGRVTGPHLHFEIYIDDTPVDPQDFIDLD